MAIWRGGSLSTFELSTISTSQQGSGVDHKICGVEPSLPVQPPVKLECEVESAGNWRRFLFNPENLWTYFPLDRTQCPACRPGVLQEPFQTPWERAPRPRSWSSVFSWRGIIIVRPWEDWSYRWSSRPSMWWWMRICRRRQRWANWRLPSQNHQSSAIGNSRSWHYLVVKSIIKSN